jgi:hypothetical protein
MIRAGEHEQGESKDWNIKILGQLRLHRHSRFGVEDDFVE